MGGNRAWALAVAAVTFLTARAADAFIFSEHSRITEDALRALADDPATRGIVNEVIMMPTFCSPRGDAPADDPKWTVGSSDCLQLVADIVAVAGDHSCNAKQLEKTLEDARAKGDHWLWSIRGIARDTDVDLNGAGDNNRRKYVLAVMTDGYAKAVERAKKSDFVDPSLKGAGDVVAARDLIRRKLNLSLQMKDPEYVSRANVDGGHFQLARQPGAITLAAYLAQAFKAGQIGNATAFYANYHVAAMRVAVQASNATGDARTALIRRAFLIETFALHFLEDSFSSGHIVGHWEEKGWPLRSEGVRIGTHDHYSNEGIETYRWVDFEGNGTGVRQSYRARGDAFMGAVDRAYAALAVTTSLGEVFRAMNGVVPAGFIENTSKVPAFEDYDSCHEAFVPAGLEALLQGPNPLVPVYALEPVVSSADPPMLRFRSEAGIFLGGAITLDGGANINHLDNSQRATLGRARATLRAGIGLAGLSSDPMNSLLFIDGGIVALGTDATDPKGDVGITFRLRAPGPFSLLDGTVIMIAAAATENPGLLREAIYAQRGGLGRLWAAQNIVRRFYMQFSALRDVTFNYFPEPIRKFRWEVMAPLVTGRVALPIAGDQLAQSNDYWFDLGVSFGRSKDLPHYGSAFDVGVFLSASTSSRTFP